MVGTIRIALSPGERIARAHLNDLEVMFDLLADTYFYAKDQSGRWVTCNTASLRLLSIADRQNIIGAREEDFFPPPVARSIRSDDLHVLRTGKRIIDRVELIANAHGGHRGCKLSGLVTEDGPPTCWSSVRWESPI